MMAATGARCTDGSKAGPKENHGVSAGLEMDAATCCVAPEQTSCAAFCLAQMWIYKAVA